MAKNSYPSILNINCWRFWIWKENAIFTLKNKEPLIKFIYMLKIHAKQKNKLLINKKQSTGLKYLNDSKAFIEYSNDVDDIYKNIEDL